MAETPRPVPPAEHPTGGDPRVEGLLIEGLERYFEGRYEDAIHLWTRVLFLDRHQASARAYIERARGAIAERQRRSDEALQAVDQLLDAGRAVEARARLAEVITSTGDDERTAALRFRVERLERVVGGSPRIHAVPAPPTDWWRHGRALANHRIRRRDLTAAVVVVAVVAVVVLSSPALRTQLGLRSIQQGPVLALTPVTVPVLSRGEVALIRARALYVRGRLAEALVALDRVGAEQTERTEADTLRVEIQRVLLAATTAGGTR